MNVRFENICVSYRKKAVLEDVSFSACQGSITALIGRNGAGKTTLLRCLTGEKGDYRGVITLDGKDVRDFDHRQRATAIACLPQELPKPRVTVRELVGFGRTPYTPLTGTFRPVDTAAVEKAMADTGIAHLADAMVDTLSGGERKKAFFAMVLAQDTPVVVLDEPTAHLDTVSRFEFLELVGRICHETGKTFLLVMHDLTDVLRFAEQIVTLHDHQVVFTGTPEACLEEKIPQTCFGVSISGSRETGFAATPLNN